MEITLQCRAPRLFFNVSFLFIAWPSSRTHLSANTRIVSAIRVETKLVGNFVAACAHDRNSQNCRRGPECASSNLLFLLAWTRQEHPCWCCWCAPTAANCAPASVNLDSDQQFDIVSTHPVGWEWIYPSTKAIFTLRDSVSWHNSPKLPRRTLTQLVPPRPTPANVVENPHRDSEKAWDYTPNARDSPAEAIDVL
jgi:hypothetical protein